MTTTTLTEQTTTAGSLSGLNIGDPIRFTHTSGRLFAAPTEVNGVVQEVTRHRMVDGVRLRVNDSVWVLPANTPVRVRSSRIMPAPRPPASTATRKTEPGAGADVNISTLLSRGRDRYASELTADDVGTHMDMTIGTISVYGTLDRITHIPTMDMVELVIDGQAFVVSAGKPVLLDTTPPAPDLDDGMSE